MKIIAIICFVVAALAVNASAGMNEFESCHCKNGLATKGDTKQEVLEDCGQPVRSQFNVRRDCYEIWLYNFGPTEFMQGICFDNSGRLKKVLSLERGY